MEASSLKGKERRRNGIEETERGKRDQTSAEKRKRSKGEEAEGEERVIVMVDTGDNLGTTKIPSMMKVYYLWIVSMNFLLNILKKIEFNPSIHENRQYEEHKSSIYNHFRY